MSELAQGIEGYLFWKGESASISELQKLTSATSEEVRSALLEIKQSLTGRGVVMTEVNNEVMLRAGDIASAFIEKARKDELERDLGRAGLETIAIILYRGPLSRHDIEYIRGVNSQFVLRHLLVRGLIERISNPKDSRSFLYQSTHDLFGYLGIQSLSELPEYEAVRVEIESFEKSRQGIDNTQHSPENESNPKTTEIDGTPENT